METSASMSGYFQQATEFKTIISDLVTKVDRNICPVNIFFTAEGTTPYSKPAGQFSSDMATTRFAKAKSSQLHQIVADVVARTDSNDISMLVSDCILSFPDADVKKNPEINKQEAPNALKNQVFSTFTDLKRKGVGASVYAFTSKFFGAYYDYQNNHPSLSGERRPFYLWVIGKRELLTRFNAKLSEISTFRPEHSLHFGLSEEPVRRYSVLPQLERAGNWMKGGETLTDVALKKGENLVFTAVVDLETLPAYARDVNYLQQHLRVEMQGGTATVQVKDKSQVDRSRLKTPNQVRALDSATHCLVFKVQSMTLPNASIHVSLPLEYDTWYLDWSTPDDKNPKDRAGKTFALDNLIRGVQEAYFTSNSNYLDFSIALNQ